ncbi:hypothetical protein AGMMS50233_10360 [Endomicrobiia bacterium]|nr:hypothetical protein AGMMS50233_10360 [Endomicrobiia bacterium]
MAEFKTPLTFGLKIKELKESLGLNSTDFVRELKEQCGLSITRSYVSRIERYGAIPRTSVIEQMAKVLEVEPSVLLGIAKSVKLANSLVRIKEKYD